MIRLSISALLVLSTGVPAATGGYYKESPLFSTAPGPEKSVNVIERFGPVGMAIELHQPAFTMVVGAIEPGSPAEAAGGLQKGQVIESLNGQTLRDIDPRIQLGQILEAAEATDGILTFMIKTDAAPREVVVKIPVLGAYSKSWPLDCPKSEKIVRNFADYLARPDPNKGFAGAGMLFLLSTGEEKDLAPVKAWVHSLDGGKNTGYAWHLGFAGIPLCEYYLRTGDPVALKVIQSWVGAARKGEYLDAWAGRGGVVKLGYGNGHLNAGGTTVVTFLMLAKQCGAEVDESLLNRTLTHFFRYAGRGINPYGDDRPETSFVDNGKHGNLAFAMAAAASLTPEGEDSLYAKARDICAITGFYTTTFMLHGHTGGGIGEIWRSSSMALMREKKPLQYREFMDHRKWHYDLSRRFDGSFGILGGEGYDKVEWGNLYPWAYTFPRKTLRITGAPPSKFSKTHALPKRPWGVEADDIFLSMQSVPDSNGGLLDLSGEVLTRHSSKPFIISLNATELTDDDFRRHIRHPEFLIRHMIANMLTGLTADYMFPKPGPKPRPHLLEEFARHADPRVRYAALRAAVRMFDPADETSKRLFAFAIERLKDDAESWFVKDACLALVGKGTPDMIVPHVDLLISYLGHPEQWLQNGALSALVVVSIDERCHEKVLPVIGEFLRKTPRQSTTGGPGYALRTILPNATPAVRDVALKALGATYTGYEGPSMWTGGQNMAGHRKETINRIAETLATVPGGYDVLFDLAKKKNPAEPLPHDEIFLAANPEIFGPKLQEAIKPIIREKLIYQYVAENRAAIFNDISKPQQRGAVENSLDDLVSLYQKIGVHDYDWRAFGQLSDAQWHYFSFEAPEKQAYDKSPWRYRPVTLPAGMENWFAPDFDPAKAGWKQGQMPIGQFEGKLETNHRGSTRQDNFWQGKPRTLWENEVLLVRQTFTLPALKDGHIYRLRVDRGQGVGAGDGFKIYINGKELVETKEGLGRRAGNTIRGAWITQEFTRELAKGPATIAAITFLRYGDRAIVTMPPVPQGIFSMWLEERKLPPLDEAVLKKAALYTPLLTSEWQAKNDPSSEEPVENPPFFYDGQFVANPAIPGTWMLVDVVGAVEDFQPAGKKVNAGRAPFQKLILTSDGGSDTPRFLWSGTTLMDIESRAALQMTPRTIDGVDYLFVESGGFNAKNPAGWKSTLTVLKK
jgi:hypothetical protein